MDSRYAKWVDTIARTDEKTGWHEANYIEYPLCLFIKPKIIKSKQCACSLKFGERSFRAVLLLPPNPAGVHVMELDKKLKDKECGEVLNVVFGYTTALRADDPKTAAMLGSNHIKIHMENNK